MSCKSTSFAKAASPVGPALISGSPNRWNVGAGNHYSHLKNPFLPDPMATRSVIRQTAGKKKRHRKQKKTKKHAIKNKKKYKRKTHNRKKHNKKTHKRKQHKRNRMSRKKRMSRKNRMSRKKYAGFFSTSKSALSCDNPKLSFSQRLACKSMSSMGKVGFNTMKKMKPEHIASAARGVRNIATSPTGRNIAKKTATSMYGIGNTMLGVKK